ncbi:MAG: single-stranded DNA-binding protein [Planctomycetes bacterium]|nr:single-stranded DNA-binding protein [Planctomycetota bacterium]
MANYNRVLLIGNLTRDPQLRYTPSQQPVCDFGIAVNRRWKAADGQMKEEVCFVDCTAWGRAAETLSKYVTKGRQLFVDGRLTFRQWDGPDGKKRSKLEVTVLGFQFLDSGKGRQAGQGAEGAGQGQGAARPAGAAAAQQPGPARDVQRQDAAAAENQAPPPADYDFSQDVEDDTIPF